MQTGGRFQDLFKLVPQSGGPSALVTCNLHAKAVLGCANINAERIALANTDTDGPDPTKVTHGDER